MSPVRVSCPNSLGHGCCTAVERTTRNQEVVGSNPAGCCDFFLLLLSFPTFLRQGNVLYQVPQGGPSLTVCCESTKNGCLAMLLGAKQAQ